MRIKVLVVLLGIEVTVITMLGEIGVSFDLWDPIFKILLGFLIVLTICMLLLFVSYHKNVNLIWRVFLRILGLFFIICFIIASVLELSQG